jgi:hypothetical protein
MVRMIRSAVRFSVALWFVFPSLAADLELRYGAMERLIAEQLFTQDGRRYVRGNAAAKCQYAFLEAPHIGADKGGADNNRLRIVAKFSGRSALDVFGTCVGLGDSFDLTILASPVPRKGFIAMEDVKVTTVKDSYYIRRVRAALQQSFAKDFKMDVREQAKKLLEQPRDNATFQQELTDFDLGGVRVTADALVLEIEFKLVVK